MKTLLVALTALALALVGTLPAIAATPAPSAATQYVDYTGTEVTTVPGTSYASPAYPTRARVDCSTGRCLLSLFVDDTSDNLMNVSLTQGLALELVDGHGSFPMAAFGSVCDDAAWLPAGVLTVTATATSLSGTRTAEANPDVKCSDGSTSGSPASVLTFSLTPVAGSRTCVLDSSCPSPKPAPTPTAAASAHHATPPTHRRTIATPGTLSTLASVATGFTVRNGIWGAAAAVVLVLLIAIPTHFFNEAAGKANERVDEWWKKRRRKGVIRASAGGASRAVRLAGWPAAAGGVIAASVISSFVDPSFGFDAASLRTFLSILVSFVIDVVIGWFALMLLVRRTHPSSTASFEFKPLTLLIVVAAVVFARVTGFQPGIVFGLVAGVTFGGLIATAEKARVALIGLAYSFGLGILAWIGYSAIVATQGGDPGAVVVFVRETLSGIAIAGSASLPIALLPLRGLTGATVWSWNRWVWGVAYGIGLFGFFVVLMPMPFSWQTVPLNLIVWIALFVGYAATSLGLWLVFARPWRPEEPAGAPADSGAPGDAAAAS